MVVRLIGRVLKHCISCRRLGEGGHMCKELLPWLGPCGWTPPRPKSSLLLRMSMTLAMRRSSRRPDSIHSMVPAI